MAGEDQVLAALGAAGTELVMMPSGVEYQIEQTPVLEMVRSGFLTGALRSVAMKVVGEGLDEQALSEDERKAWDKLQNQMICRWVRGFAWTCECAGCLKRRAQAGLEPMPLRPWKLTPEVLTADPPQISRVDLAALSDMTLFLRTPRMVDAFSRVAHGQMELEEARHITAEEARATAPAWTSFRGVGGGAGLRAPGEVLGDDASRVRRPDRATRRAAGQRRPVSTGARRARKTG